VIAAHVEPVDEQGAVEPDGALGIAAEVEVSVTGYLVLDNQVATNNPGSESLVVGKRVRFPSC
jgi:hypothetical protein